MATDDSDPMFWVLMIFFLGCFMAIGVSVYNSEIGYCKEIGGHWVEYSWAGSKGTHYEERCERGPAP